MSESEAVVAPPPMPNVLACIPLYEMVYSDFLQTFLQSIRGSAGVLMLKGTYIQDAFNQMVQQALETHPDAEWFFFFEQDMILPEGTLGVVQDYKEPGIYGGIYFGRSVDDQRPIPGRFNEQTKTMTRLEPAELDPMMQKPGMYPMDCVGLGCTFVHRKVFEGWNSEHEAFADHEPRYCNTHEVWFATPPGPDPISVMSHDVWFTWHARAQGFPVYLDTRIQAQHKGLAPFSYPSHLGWRRQVLAQQQAQLQASKPVLSPALRRSKRQTRRKARK